MVLEAVRSTASPIPSPLKDDEVSSTAFLDKVAQATEGKIGSAISIPSFEGRSVVEIRSQLLELGNALVPLITYLLQKDQTMNLISQIYEAEAKSDTEQVEQLNKELKDLIVKHLKASYEERMIKVWEGVAQDFLSALTIAGGVTLIASGASAAGSLLVTAGGISLLNRILSDTGGWKTLIGYFTTNQEIQDKVERRLTLAFFLLSLSLSISGSILAFPAGGISALSDAEKFRVAATAVGSMANSGLKLGSAAVKSKGAEMKAKISIASAQITHINYNQKFQLSQLKGDHEAYQSLLSAIKQIVQQQRKPIF